MSGRRRWSIRIVQLEEGEPAFGTMSVLAYEILGTFLHVLERAGLVNVLATYTKENPNRRVVEILPPAHVRDSQNWAAVNAIYMQSFGINAVAAPEWRRDMSGKPEAPFEQGRRPDGTQEKCTRT